MTRHTQPDPAFCISFEVALRLLGWKLRWFLEQLRKNQITPIYSPRKSRNGRRKVLGITPGDIEKLSTEAYQAWLLEREREAEERLAEVGLAEKETKAFVSDHRRLSLLQIERKYGSAKVVAVFKEGEQLRNWKTLPGAERKRELLSQGLNETWFKRRLKRFKLFGYGGLVHPESVFKGKRRSVTPEFENFIRKLRLTRKYSTLPALYQTIQEHAKEKGWRVPSDTTVRRIFSTIPDSVDCRARRGVKEYRDKYEPIIRRGRVDAPGLIYCADHHQLDLTVWNEWKKAFGWESVRDEDRPWITAVMDLFNNDLIGWVLSWQPNSQTIALALRQAFLSPHGVCKELLIDNGKDYLSAYIEGLCASLGIKIRPCERYHGQSKPLERWFRILEERLIAELPGFLGNKPANRPEHAKASLNLVEIQRMVELWNTAEYRNLKSKALGGRSPNELWAQALADGYVARIPDVRALDLLLMPTRERKIYKDGVRLFGFYFWNDALIPLINDTDENGLNRKVEVRFDPAFIGEVHVFVEGKFFCTARNQPLAGWGASEEDIKTVQHRRKCANEFFKNYTESAHVGHAGQALVGETAQQRLERLHAAQQQEMPKAVGQSNVHMFLGAFDSAARTIAPRGEGRPPETSPARRPAVSQDTWFGTPDENNVPECGDHREMLKRYRTLNLLHVMPVRYLDPNRELEQQVWQPEKLSEDVRQFFKQRGLYKEE